MSITLFALTIGLHPFFWLSNELNAASSLWAQYTYIKLVDADFQVMLTCAKEEEEHLKKRVLLNVGFSGGVHL